MHMSMEMSQAAAMPSAMAPPAWSSSRPATCHAVGEWPRAISIMVRNNTAPTPSLNSDSPASCD